MVNQAELLSWVVSLGPEASVGIDAGGLMLLAIGPDDRATGEYYEIGAVPVGQNFEDWSREGRERRA